MQLTATTSLTPALSPRRGRIISSAGQGSLIREHSQRVKKWNPLLGERVRVRASLITNQVGEGDVVPAPEGDPTQSEL
jgi:hypothetical protein